MPLGSNLCISCGSIINQPERKNSSNSNFTNNNVNSTMNTYPSNTPFPLAPQSQQRNKRGTIEFVSKKPNFLTSKEVKDIFIAYSVIYVGFVLRRIIFTDNTFLTSIIETIALIVSIFGVWFLIDKTISYLFHFYPKFVYDPEKSFMALIFAFIFIGFPPGYYKYRVWVNRLPKPNSIIKIQYITYLILISYGWVWYFLIILFPELIVLDIISIIPFVISLSVGLGILPFGSFKLVLKHNKYLYYLLALLTIGLFIGSYQFLLLSNF